MQTWLQRIGLLLRTGQSAKNGIASINISFLLAATVVLGGIYGLFMGGYAIRTEGLAGTAQMISATVKVPLLFLLTITVTFPSLYVFNTLMGSRLSFEQTLRTVAGWIVVVVAIAASLGPILGFFTISSKSYPFIVLLNVLLLGLSGTIGCASLMRMLRAASSIDELEKPASQSAEVNTEINPTSLLASDSTDETREPDSHSIESQPQSKAIEFTRGRDRPLLSHADSHQQDIASRTLILWVIIFGIIGLQMAWVLRPFIGAPGEEFALFRSTQSNGFAAVFRVISSLFGAE